VSAARRSPRDPAPHAVDGSLTDRPRPGVVRALAAAAVASAAAWLALQLFAPHGTVTWSSEMHAAAARTQQAHAIVAEAAAAGGVLMPAATDPNRTGYIGPAYSELFTTTGQLEAKRTATNPDMSALVAHLLRRAGAEAGDTVAIGASASFPALIIAAVVAVESLGMHPVVVLSLGSSGWGATNPAFDALRIYQLVVGHGIIDTPPAAVSLGGAGDVGASLDDDVRDRLLARIRDAGVPLLFEPDIARNVRRRTDTRLADTGAGARPALPAVYLNIGGNDASLGSSPLVLELRPGLNIAVPLPPPGQRGVIAAMAAHGVPVIHLLNMRGLAARYGLPWDPVPLPAAGTTPIRDDATRDAGPAVLLIAAAWLAALALLGRQAQRAHSRSLYGPDPDVT
jgi:poly-gamma-glutamate system protein